MAAQESAETSWPAVRWAIGGGWVSSAVVSSLSNPRCWRCNQRRGLDNGVALSMTRFTMEPVSPVGEPNPCSRCVGSGAESSLSSRKGLDGDGSGYHQGTRPLVRCCPGPR